MFVYESGSEEKEKRYYIIFDRIKRSLELISVERERVREKERRERGIIGKADTQ